MTSNRLLMIVAAAGLASCATTAPPELVKAREAYRHASAGSTATVSPAELHVAKQALDKAERSFQDMPDSYRTRDLAYVAQRKSELAEATASLTTSRNSHTQANDDYQATQDTMAAKGKEDLSEARRALAASEASGELTTERLSSEQMARTAADQRAADAQAALAKLAAVKEEPRGVVITLSGSVLFASNQSTLLPAARARLDQVATVLLTTPERNLTINGYTDSQGPESYNLALSQRRADAVRDYFVRRDYRADRITAHGLGEGHPIADNASPEGRANNRRVEIVIEREPHASSQ
jgi:outer membrane protein OmpA-like peptidoglycan-associated protein